MMKVLVRTVLACVIIAAAACASAPPAAPGAPKYPDLPVPEIPASVRVTQAVRDQHGEAWRRLQAGDLRGANRAYAEILRLSSTFYPAEAGLGAVELADRDYKSAAIRFRAALGSNNAYVPAWRGLVDAEAGAGNDTEAMAALERLLALDGSRESDRTRLELLRLRDVQKLIDAGIRARQAGRLDEADGLLTRALAQSPSSTAVLRELTQVEITAGQFDEAEVHARRAVEIDATDAGALAALASVFEAQGRLREAAAQLALAATIDPAAWREKAEAARARAAEAAVPPEMKAIATATSVTRGQLAALIDARFTTLLRPVPNRVPDVATDARSYWAADAIINVTRAGVMDVYANHTFQPGGVVRRADLAAAVAKLAALASESKPAQFTAWQNARPTFADVAPANLFYRSAALAVSAGAMSVIADRFEPTRAATGAEVLAALGRIEQLNGRLPAASQLAGR
jgi:tetratricopeptide (TPR) repeat protein